MIQLERVTKTYPGDEEPVLDNISLHIEPHEFVFLVGKSGAGKSTLIKMITKEENPDSGKIMVGGIDLDFVRRRHIPHYRRRLGVVFQDYKLLPTRTVFENVAFALEIAGMGSREIHRTVPKVLDLVGLESKANKFPTNLSGGERQRVAIARSVARQPKILIADEPTGNLDPQTMREIVDLLQKINDHGTTLLVTTHDEDIVNNLSKRVITLKKGRIIGDQKVHGIYQLDNTLETSAEPTPEPIAEEPAFEIVTNTPVIHKVYRSNGAVRSVAPAKSQSVSTTVRRSTPPKLQSVNNLTRSTVAKPSRPATNTSRTTAKPQPAKSPATKVAPSQKPTAKPSAPAKKYAHDSANQWYTAGKPLKAAPKLSKLSLGQTVKLKPAPSIKQVVKRPLGKTKPKRIV